MRKGHPGSRGLQLVADEKLIAARSTETVTPTDLYKVPDAVPPIHAESYHVATDKVPAKNGDKFRSILCDNLQPIATRGKKARSTLSVDNTVTTAVLLSAHPSPLVITTKLAAAILGVALFGRGALPVQYYPCGEETSSSA